MTHHAKKNEPSADLYILHLYITGATYHSMMAIRNIKLLCENLLTNKYKLEIIDIYEQPELAEQKQIIASPTLIKLSPLPTRRLIGDMSDTKAVISSLGIVV